MPSETHSARTIFLDALERPTSAERVQFVAAACNGDNDLRREVDRLLAANRDLNSFMGRPAAAGLAATVNLPAAEQVGAMIGRYKLLEQIGEGGMGMVYVAEQTEPVRRRVALKIIKPGMDTRQVIARFEAERQALAMMDHPNIAKVLDAGTTEPPLTPGGRGVGGEGTGRPYFVMELVRGMPITDYCDQARLNPRGRLELFMTVCLAVQHAHQKGIIHRDIKPNNVLVTLHDGQPVAKVIDFGVAKAVNQNLTDRTIYTAHTEMIGTPLYMSPEQAELSGLDVDTRSDVYSLGVLLYELLTGQTPFDRDTLVKPGLDEVRRMIREDEPPRPSHRISTLKANAGSTVGQRRGVDQRQLTRTLKGELDWIVMKALEKNRNRRYESASDFAADIGRYLTHEPVEACPPSALYRFSKFARRRRGALVAATFVALSLVAGIGLSLWQAVEADAARELAHQGAVDEGFARRRAESNLRRGNEAVEILLSRVAEEQLLDEPRLEKLRVALLTDALRINSSFLDENPEDAEAKFEATKAYRRMAEIYGHLGDHQKSAAASRQAIRLLESLIDGRPDDRRFRQELAKAYRPLSHSRFNGAPGDENPCDLHRKYLSLLERLAAASPDDSVLLQRVSEACYVLGYSLQGANPEESHALLRRSVAIGAELVEHHPDRPDIQEHLARSQWFLGRVLSNSKKYEKAKQEFLSALSASTEALTNSPRSAAIRKTHIDILNSLARVCADTSHKRALSYARQAQTAAEELVADYPSSSGYLRVLIFTQMNIADCLKAAEEFEQARQQRVKCLEMAKRLWSDFPENPENQENLAWAHLNLANSYCDLGKLDAALAEYVSAGEVYAGSMKQWPDYRDYRHTLCWLLVRQAMCHDVLGDFQEGTKCYKKAASLDPDDDWTHEKCIRQLFGLADDLWKMGRHDEARRTWAAAIERTRISFDSVPSDLVRFNLGVAHYRLGNYKESSQHFQESIDFLDRNNLAEHSGHGNCGHFYFLAMTHASLGKKDEAQKWFERGRQWDKQHTPSLQPQDRDSNRAIRQEAAKLLGISDEAEEAETPVTPAKG